MRHTRPRRTAAIPATAATLSLAACGGHSGNNPSAENAAGTSVTPAAANAPAAPESGTTAAVAPGQTADSTTATHHSKLAGAALGAVAGHAVGGTKGAIAGAVIGAEIQHHRNKAYERTHP